MEGAKPAKPRVRVEISSSHEPQPPHLEAPATFLFRASASPMDGTYLACQLSTSRRPLAHRMLLQATVLSLTPSTNPQRLPRLQWEPVYQTRREFNENSTRGKNRHPGEHQEEDERGRQGQQMRSNTIASADEAYR
jgi:hypothetical protein